MKSDKRQLEAVKVDETAIAETITTFLAPESNSAGQPSSAPSPIIPGYHDLKEINRGGQGIVYAAQQEHPRRKVAIKLLLAGAFSSPAARRRFDREIEIIAQLQHSNIVAVYEAGETPEGHGYFVMEYVRGLPLGKHVRDKSHKLADLLKLFAQICEAVQYAHQRGVIHRDLKPSNILVTPDGLPKILDFGLAKPLMAEGDQLSVTEQIFGTLPYMAPEQARARQDAVDTRSDVYSLGIILFELLTGTYPYPVTGHVLDVVQHIAKTPPTRPGSAVSGSGYARALNSGSWIGRSAIDYDLETIVLKTLAKEPERRYQSAGDLARDIHRYLNGEAIDARRDSTWYVLRKALQRNARPAIAAAAMIVIAISAGVISLDFRSQANQAIASKAESDALVNEQAFRVSQLSETNLRAAIHEHVLPWFLLEWQAGRIDAARKLIDTLPKDAPERQAMLYLLDDSITNQTLRTQLPAAYATMGEFVIAERAIRDGRQSDAVAAYQRAVVTEGSSWIQNRARTRLSELTGEDVSCVVE